MIVCDKIAVVGSRNFSNYDLLSEWLDKFYMRQHTIVSGGALGADLLAEKYANRNGLTMEKYLPDWEKYGKRAGPMRNEDIVKNADIVIAFWNGESKGTQSTISIAKRLKKPTVIIYF